jgi:nitrite reductase (cytochrome c-552)
LIRAIEEVRARGTTGEQLAAACAPHRAARCRAESSRGFHASQEAARVLGQAFDLARQGQLKAVMVGRRR